MIQLMQTGLSIVTSIPLPTAFIMHFWIMVRLLGQELIRLSSPEKKILDLSMIRSTNFVM